MHDFIDEQATGSKVMLKITEKGIEDMTLIEDMT